MPWIPREANQIRLPVRRGQDVACRGGRRSPRGRSAAREPAAAHRQGVSPDRPAVGEYAFLRAGVSKALGRTITFADIPVEAWRDGLLARGLPVHPVNHLVTMANLHRAGRYDRISDDVLTLTGQRAMSVQEFVRKHAATFTAFAKAA